MIGEQDMHLLADPGELAGNRARGVADRRDRRCAEYDGADVLGPENSEYLVAGDAAGGPGDGGELVRSGRDRRRSIPMQDLVPDMSCFGKGPVQVKLAAMPSQRGHVDVRKGRQEDGLPGGGLEQVGQPAGGGWAGREIGVLTRG